MTIQLLIGGVDKTSLLQRGSLNIKKAINERSLLDFELKDCAGAYRPSPGQTVQLYDGATLVFAGVVDEPEEEIPIATTLLINQVPVNDWHEIADRFLVAETYENQTCGYIVADLRTKYLNGDGVTAGTIQDGPTVSKAVFNYVPVSQALDELSELSGFQWEITPAKALGFYDRATYAAAWDITSSSAIRNVKVRKERSNYRNRQYLRAGQDISDSQTRQFAGDGKTTTFTVDLPLAAEPTITVNGVAKTVGIQSVETGKDWYWSKNDKTISQDTGGTVLTASDTLQVVFTGYFPIMVVGEDPAAITERVTAEGGTGIYERIESKESIDTSDAALEYANGLLRRYATIGNVVTYETDTSGLEPGMIQNIVLATHSLNGDFLVSRVDIVDPGFASQGLRYRITALDGEAVGSWAQFFRKLVQNQQTFTIRDNEVLTRQVRFADAWGWLEEITKTINSCPVPSLESYEYDFDFEDSWDWDSYFFIAGEDILYPADDLYPC